ncbi:MAG TPA: FAD-linked oxidase C-terminal domain-containing protein, partial [Ktedonobacterales bacterium]
GGIALTQAGARMTLPIEGEAQTTFWAALDNYAQCATSDDDALARVFAQPSECATLLDMALNSIKGNSGVATWLADAVTGTIWLRIHAHEKVSVDRSAMLGDALVSLCEALRERGGAPAVIAAPAELASRRVLWDVSEATGGLMRDIKQRFDPDGLLNPGRTVVG